MSNLWDHALCADCWIKRCEDRGVEAYLPAVRLRSPDPRPCCRCGYATSSGIFVRDNPDKWPCGGGHGRANPGDPAVWGAARFTLLVGAVLADHDGYDLGVMIATECRTGAAVPIVVAKTPEGHYIPLARLIPPDGAFEYKPSEGMGVLWRGGETEKGES